MSCRVTIDQIMQFQFWSTIWMKASPASPHCALIFVRHPRHFAEIEEVIGTERTVVNRMLIQPSTDPVPAYAQPCNSFRYAC